jgi:acetyl-CoA synthetase (ADP-forming)
MVSTQEEFKKALSEIGYPLVIKGCSPGLIHKTEQGLVRVDVRSEKEANDAFQEFMTAMKGEERAILVQEMVKGLRELMVGMTRDPQFGRDISFRVAPLEKRDALEMMREIKAHKILDKVRGMPAADLEELSETLIRVGEIGLEIDAIKEIDINPLIISGRRPVAVDALVVLNPGS